MSKSLKSGFTLAELLISLAILGMIATFTIPKLILAQQNGQYAASAKEAAAMVAAAYATSSSTQTITSGFRFGDLTPYMNFITIDTSSTIDDKYTLGTLSCNVSSPGGCLVLANGGKLRYTNDTLVGTASTNAIEFYFDPNGTSSGTTNSPDKSVHLFIYYGGRITSRGNTTANTVAAGVTYASANSTFEPPWFYW